MKTHLSDFLSFENDDIKAEYIYQRIFGFHDVLATCLESVGEVFSMRRPLADKPGRPIELFLKECRKASCCSLVTESEDRVVVTLQCIVVSYESKQKCLSIAPTERVRQTIEQGRNRCLVELPEQHYWITAQFFPPFSVFRELDQECARFLADYDTLQAWHDTDECLAIEELTREVFSEVERLHAVWPDPWEEVLIFGFPTEESLRLSFAQKVEDANGRDGITVPLAEWKRALYTLLMKKLDVGRQRAEGELRLLQIARDAFRARIDYVVSQSELDAIPVLSDTKTPEEAYYHSLMLKKARSQHTNFLVEDFLRSYRFFVKGKRTDARLILDAENYMGSDCEVRNDEDGQLLSISYHFPLFTADYDFRQEHLTITLDKRRFEEFPTTDNVMNFDKESEGTHFSIRVLCDCHYALVSALKSVSFAQEQAVRDGALFQQCSACLRSVLFRVGGLTVPVGDEPPTFQLYLLPVSGKSLTFRLDPMTDKEERVTASLPLVSFESALMIWWSRWTMKRIMDYKKREKALCIHIASFDRTASLMQAGL